MGAGNCAILDLSAKSIPSFSSERLGIELRFPRSPSAIKQRFAISLLVPMSFLSRVTSQSAFVEMQVCEHCSFIQTSVPFHEDDIMRLYARLSISRL